MTAITPATSPATMWPPGFGDNNIKYIHEVQPVIGTRMAAVMDVGSSCTESEGQWNCMSTTFQRCASGQWSVVMQTAPGTVCEPEGLTNNEQAAFEIDYATVGVPQSVSATVTTTSTQTAHSTVTITSTSIIVSSAASGTRKNGSSGGARVVSLRTLGTVGLGLGAVFLAVM